MTTANDQTLLTLLEHQAHNGCALDVNDFELNLSTEALKGKDPNIEVEWVEYPRGCWRGQHNTEEDTYGFKLKRGHLLLPRVSLTEEGVIQANKIKARKEEATTDKQLTQTKEALTSVVKKSWKAFVWVVLAIIIGVATKFGDDIYSWVSEMLK